MTDPADEPDVTAHEPDVPVAEYDAATGLAKRLGNRVVVNGPIQY